MTGIGPGPKLAAPAAASGFSGLAGTGGGSDSPVAMPGGAHSLPGKAW